MSYILHIETATKICSVALSNNGVLSQLMEIDDDHYAHGEKLTLLIEDVLKLEGVSVNKLSAVSVSAGPGSYTGLRIGVSTVKGICYALSLPLIALDTLQIMVEGAKERNPNQVICAMIDARRMEVYSSIYSSENSCIKDVSPDILDELTYKEFEPFVCVGDGANKMQELWSNRNVLFDLETKISAKDQVRLAFEKFRNNQFEDVAYFEPNYVKSFHDTRK